MEAARSAINKITGRSGHHDTEVDEVVNPAVTQETVKPHRHEETTAAIDKEVHQDHYHTTVQPLQDREVLPEKHHHQQLPTQEREFRHGDNSQVHRRVENEAAQFSNSSATTGTTHSTSQAAAANGEHFHHHVHETVQPVIHKETHQPEVVHTTIPIHERHQAPSEHHGMSVLPTKTLGEIEASGQPVTGTTHRSMDYKGDPRSYDPSLQVKRNAIDKDFEQHDGLHGVHSSTATGDHTSKATSGAGVGARAGAAVEGAATGDSHHHSGRSAHPSTNQENNTGSSRNDGHGITNQVHHGTERDNVDRTHGSSQDVQHGTQGKDPAVVDKTEKKLTGTGADGSHSAVFGLTPDGHKTTETNSETTGLKPAHSKDVSNTEDTRRNQGGLPEQLTDPRVAEKGHDKSNVSDGHGTGTTKPGAGAPGGEQGFGQVRPEDHGMTDKVQNKLDPNTDADRDGKRGVMD